MATINITGKYNSSYVSDIWHRLGSGEYGGLNASGSLTVTRESEKSSSVSISGTCKSALVYGSGSASVWQYDYTVGVALILGGTTYTVPDDYDSSNKYLTGGTTLYSVTSENMNSSSISVSINTNVEITNNDTTLYVCYKCGQTGGCTVGYTGSKSSPNSTWIVVGSISTSEFPYNPYTPHTYSINSISPTIGIVNSTTYTVNYSISGGTNTLDWVIARIYNTSGTVLEEHSFSTSTGTGLTGTFKLSSSRSDGTQYKVAVRFSDNYAEYETGKLDFYAYRTPTIGSFKLDPQTFSGFGNSTMSWSTNQRRWSNTIGETDFTTALKLSSSGSDTYSTTNIDQSPTGTNATNTNTSASQSLTESLITSRLTTSNLNSITSSKGSVSSTFTLKRTNPSSGVTATKTTTATIQFAPKYTPSSMTFYKSDSSSTKGNTITAGSTIYFSDTPYVLVTWIYSTEEDRGVIDGFTVTIYKDSSYSTTYSITNVATSSHNQTSGQLLYNTKTGLYRGHLNYIGIKAYYTRPDGTKVYGGELKSSFVLPLGKILTPIISYPINNTTWHNDNYRILFTMPDDEDIDSVGNTDYATSTSDYVYKDIEVNINGVAYLYSNYSAAFSISTLGYQYKVCINPSLMSAFESASTYTIKVRVQKNYYSNIWSSYSSIATLNKSEVNRWDLGVGDLILATHYKRIQSASEKSWNVYPISTLPTDNINKDIGDVILYKNYQAIFNTILQIQNDVNNWARFDSGKDNVKFNQTINKLTEGSTNECQQDIITAEDDLRPTIQGRNYINILIDCLNLLY